MPITTPLTALLGITHPILLGADGHDCRRAACCGGQRGRRLRHSRRRLRRQGLARAGDRQAGEVRKRHSASASSPGAWQSGRNCSTSRWRRSRARSCCRSAIPGPIAPRIKAAGSAADLPGAERGHGAASARCRRRHFDRAGQRSRRPWRLAHHHRHRAGSRRSRGRARAGGCGRRHRPTGEGWRQ